jgi:hypothetical protein
MLPRYAVSVANYLQARMEEGIGVPGQPALQHYFHRPLAMLLNTAFAPGGHPGFVLDRLEEPAFPAGMPATQAVSQVNFQYIPWVLVARLRVAG